MKYKVHRVRFVDYTPQAIHCLAFEDVKVHPRLALSRADSSIEIWCPKSDWCQQLIIPGCDGTSVESLVWCGSRLFSAGLHGEITEWDLGRLALKMSISSLGGAVWSLAINHAKNLMAVGCEDGCVRLFDITPEGLQYLSSLNKQESRVLSISWHLSDEVLVIGSSDSTVKVYNVKTGHCSLRITMEEFKSRNTLIWSVHITSDLTIITGDSHGNTQFWDGKLGALFQSYSAHEGDVLSLCINKEEDTVFSAGVDSKVVKYELLKTVKNGKWINTGFTRVHTHDVRALAINEAQNILVSGGLDTKLGVYSIAKFSESQPSLTLPFPHKSFITLASAANIVMEQCQRSLRFWKLGETDGESTLIEKSPCQLLQMKAKNDNHIMCSAITPCSSLVAFSDVIHVSLFKVNLCSQDATEFKVSRVLPLPIDLLPAQKMLFTEDGLKLICATHQNSIQVLEIGEEVTLGATIHLPSSSKNDLPAMCLLAVSSDGHWAACVDSRNAVNVIDLHTNKHHSELPTFSSHVTAMAFQPQTQYLAIVCSDKQIFIYKTKSNKLTDWAKQAAAKGLPKELVQSRSKIVGITFDPSCIDLMILQDHKKFTVIDLREPLPEQDVLCENSVKSGNRKRQFENVEQKCIRLCRKYMPLLFMDFCKDGSLVVVERPWLKVMETLPPTLKRKRYGKS